MSGRCDGRGRRTEEEVSGRGKSAQVVEGVNGELSSLNFTTLTLGQTIG